jgi:hypothetical protein
MDGSGGNHVADVLLTSRGKLDSRVGRNSILQPRVLRICDVTIQKDGKVVVLTTHPALDQGGYALTRLLPNGSRDRSFGAGGTMTVQLARGSSGRRVASLPTANSWSPRWSGRATQPSPLPAIFDSG